MSRISLMRKSEHKQISTTEIPEYQSISKYLCMSSNTRCLKLLRARFLFRGLDLKVVIGSNSDGSRNCNENLPHAHTFKWEIFGLLCMWRGTNLAQDVINDATNNKRE